MPVLQISRQPDALAWFDTVKGRSVLTAEQQVIGAAFAARPARQPWLWLAPAFTSHPGMEPAPVAPPGSVLLRPFRDHYAGSLQCALPLPLADESVGNLIVQHVLDDEREGLLEECERILEPGGRLWLFALNPWSPYRARWRRSGLVARDAHYWHLRLRRLGLQPCDSDVAYLGPVWRPAVAAAGRGPSRLRVACVMEVEKRTAALIPPAPVSRHWQTGAATA